MAGINAFGVQLQLGDGLGAYTAIANVTSVNPSIERETIDVTAHDSPGGWLEKLGGLKDGGELTANVNYDPTKHDVLLDEFEKDDPSPWRVVWPDAAAYWDVDAILTGFSPEGPHDDKATAEITLAVSGQPLLAVGAPA